MLDQDRISQHGFSLVELLMVVGIIGVLLALAAEQFQVYQYRSRITHGVGAVYGLRQDLMEYFTVQGTWPTDARELRYGIATVERPPFITGIEVAQAGAIHIRFQSPPGRSITNPVLPIRPALSGGDGPGTIIWICGRAPIPQQAVVFGENLTNIPEDYLINSCR